VQCFTARMHFTAHMHLLRTTAAFGLEKDARVLFNLHRFCTVITQQVFAFGGCKPKHKVHCKNSVCVHIIVRNCCNATQHGTVVIIFSLVLWTVIIAQMWFVGGEQ